MPAVNFHAIVSVTQQSIHMQQVKAVQIVAQQQVLPWSHSLPYILLLEIMMF